MDRENIINGLLLPLDKGMEGVVYLLDRFQLSDPAADVSYEQLRRGLYANFRRSNQLEIEGIENIPHQGGVLLAANHQSWLDVQVLVASSSRRLFFVAKSEFQSWPVLRHLIHFSSSVFVQRGGDTQALDSISAALAEGKAVAIFPEGTIPGEENVSRRAVDPQTGLLPGRTGVVRLALRNNVPIIPVGISGSGRAFPPEIYPRLEVLRMPGNTPIRIRFGQPISMEEYRQMPQTRALFRELTDSLMRKISGLVDHQDNYVPIKVPVPEPPKFERLGVLLLHGFTGHLDTVRALVPHLEAAGLDYELPVLRGHMAEPSALCGVGSRDWYADAEVAFLKLAGRVDRVLVVGLSMGGLVALELSMNYADKIAALALVAPALKFANPLARYTGKIGKLLKYWPSPNSFNDRKLKVHCKNYAKFPVDSFSSLYQYGLEIAQRLNEVNVPTAIFMSKKDQIVAVEAANIIYEKVATMHREIVWYKKSGHEMFQDLEAQQVCADVMDFIHRFELQPRLAMAASSRQP